MFLSACAQKSHDVGFNKIVQRVPLHRVVMQVLVWFVLTNLINKHINQTTSCFLGGEVHVRTEALLMHDGRFVFYSIEWDWL